MADSRKSILILQKKAEKALKQAVRQAIKDHARAGQPFVIWKNGKVIKMMASRLLRKAS